MNLQFTAMVTKVSPRVTAGKDEAPRRLLVLELDKEFDDATAVALRARPVRQQLRSGDIDSADISLTALVLKATIKGLARGERQGEQTMTLYGLVAKAAAPAEEDGAPTVRLVFNLDYSSAHCVFLVENLKNTVDVTLEKLQLDNALAGEQPTKAPKPAKPDRQLALEKPKRGRKPNGAPGHDDPPAAA